MSSFPIAKMINKILWLKPLQGERFILVIGIQSVCHRGEDVASGRKGIQVGEETEWSLCLHAQGAESR